jgi:hypothetical protein
LHLQSLPSSPQLYKDVASCLEHPVCAPDILMFEHTLGDGN